MGCNFFFPFSFSLSVCNFLKLLRFDCRKSDNSFADRICGNEERQRRNILSQRDRKKRCWMMMMALRREMKKILLSTLSKSRQRSGDNGNGPVGFSGLPFDLLDFLVLFRNGYTLKPFCNKPLHLFRIIFSCSI